MINIHLVHDAAFLWDADDIYTLRKEYRIVGFPVGAHPTKIWRLPVRLMLEEAKLLVDKGIAQLLSYPDEVSEEKVIDTHGIQKRNCAEQVTLNRGSSLKEIRSNNSDPKAAKIDTDKIKEIPRKDAAIQIFTECRRKKRVTTAMPSRYFSSTEDQLRYAVFKDLYEKNFYITGGLEFGGDYLAYAGDPLMHDALFIVVCMPASKKIQGLDIVSLARLGHQEKKTVAFASLNDKGEVEYISIEYIR